MLRNSISNALALATALSALSCAGAAPAQSPANGFAGDSRLAVKRTFRFKNAPVRDVLADINQATGIRLFSDQAVADNRLSLIVHDRAVSETLTGIAAFYGWEWRRDEPKPGAKGGIGYTLTQTQAAQRADRDFVESQLTRLSGLLKKEADAYATLTLVDQKQRERIEEQLPTIAAQETDPEKRETLRVQSLVLQDLHERRLWKPPVFRLIQSLPPAQLSEIVHSATTCFSYPLLPGCKPIPEERIQELKQVFLQDVVPTGVPRGQIVSVRVRFSLVAGKAPYLKTSLQIAQRTTYGISTYGMLTPMPASYTLLSEVNGPLPPIEPADWKSDASLMQTVTVKLPDAPKPPEKDEKPDTQEPKRAEAQAPLPYVWLTDVLDKIDSAAPLDVISDGLWSTRMAGIDVRDMPVGDILTRLGRGSGHRWWKQDGFVMMQSRTLSGDRWAEPPATAVARWAEQIDRGWFGLDEFADLASLPDAQAMTLQDMSMAEQFPMFMSPLNNSRSQLLFWNALTPAQRRKALGSGLAFSELMPEQQPLFVLAATDPSASQQSSVVPDTTLLSKAKLRIETQERACWGVHRMGPFATWRIPRGPDPDNAIEKRDDAIRRFLASDSTIRPEDIQAMTLVVHSFVYESGNEPLARAMLQLPPRWEPN